ELILACRQRIAIDDDKTRIGLPEVMLGIHPGWGGSARLPRLIGATEAMPVMLTGKPLSARRALSLGVVDAISRPQDLLAEARLLLRRPPARPFARRAKAWASNTWLARQILAPVMLRQTAARVRKEHYPAPFALIDVWKRGGSSIQQRLKLEAGSVAKLAQTSTAQNLIRIFFLQERLKNQGGGVDADIRHVDVVGKGVASADLAIEAIYENAEAKESLYAGIEPQFQADEILASNTSSIPLDELRKNLAAPQRFLGLHFFNPVAQMPLVELVRHD